MARLGFANDDESFKGQVQPAEYMESVTPSDTTKFTKTARAIECTGAAGTITLLFPNGATLARTIRLDQRIDCFCDRVNSTGTTATGLVAYF